MTISVNKRNWQYAYEGRNPETKMVLGHCVMLTTVNEGSLTFLMTYLFDLQDGWKVVETDMSLLYEDKQRITQVLHLDRVSE